MRILHVIPWLAPRYGGPAMLVPQACVALSERGHHVEIITTNADRPGVLDVPTGKVIDWAGAAATFHPISAPTWYLTSWSMLADLRRRVAGFDIVHIHTLYRFPGLAAAALARARGVPYVIQAHGSLDPWHRQQKRRAKDLYHVLVQDPIIRGAAAIACTSRREEASIRDLGYKVPAWVIPIGIDADELRLPGAPDFAVATGIGADARVVTFLGRISEKKGVPLLVDAFRITAAAFPRAHLVIAGPDDEGIGRGLAPMIAEAGLADRISFLGVVGGPLKRSLLQRSEVFVLPSADESFAVAVAEAMAVGCPVVVSPEVAIEDVVRASGAGLVVRRDPSAFADAIATVLSTPARAAAMGAAGRRAVDEQFSWPIVATQMEAMYHAIVRARAERQSGNTAARTPRVSEESLSRNACMERPGVRLLVSGYFGRGNVGDDAMLEAFAAEVEGRPDFELIQRPLPATGLRGLRAAPSFVRSLVRSDALVLVGGTHFHGSFGRTSTRILFQFWLLFGLARALGKPVSLAGMGVETPEGWSNSFLMRRCLALASIALLRDQESEVAAARLAPDLQVISGVDLAFLLAGPVPSTREDKLVVSVLPYGKLHAFGAAAHERYLDALAEAIDSLPTPHRPERVQILGMYSGHHPNDIDVARDLAARVLTIPVETTIVFTPTDALREISSARAMLTGRYHALLFAYLVNTPVSAISHQPKVSSLCRVIGLPPDRWLALDEALVNGALKRLVLATMTSAPVPPRKPDLAGAATSALRRFLDEVASMVVAMESR